TLPMHVRLGSYDTTAPAVTVTAANPFGTTPTLAGNATFTNDLLPFRLLDSHNTVGLLNRFQTWANGFRGSAIFTTPIPFTQGRTLGDVFGFGTALANRLTGALSYDATPTFLSAQQLADQLDVLFELPGGRVRASYNPATKDVGFRVDFTE